MTDDEIPTDPPGPPRFQGHADSGSYGRDTGRVGQLSENDLKGMSPDEIVAAEDAGQLDELLNRGAYNHRYRD
ncbi:hypothetical protein F9278_23185 [Streptomyces phaeolivaceus]|uniref:Uncharacterized protein n=1 Tax=Streptomyces phaeolivaceus TaxID=2653200 RepID=A0A5P8K6A8_9ACTN|nr:hypothetical protein [Streptomyces phaeolivaceus]QFQ98584.1 hypothetical protein F9278_23185 [Streptomyces phaeolivaceus]